VISRAVYRRRQSLEQAIGHQPGVRFVRTINLGLAARGRMAKVVVMLLYVLHAAAYSLFASEVDRNVFLTQPPLFPLWGVVLCRLRRQPYTCVIMDLYPDEAVAVGLMRRDALLTKLFSRLMRLAWHQAEGVIVIGRCMADRLQAMGVPSSRVHFIANWMDERLVYPVEHEDNPLRRQWGLQDKFVVLYAGNVGLAHDFNDVLTVAEQWKDREDVVFVFVGDGSRYGEVKARSEERCLSNVQLRPFQEMDTWARVYGAGDLHLIVLREDCTGLGVPSKTYGILAAGRPILYQGSREGEIARLILEEGVGTVVPLGDVQGLQQGILKYLEQPELGRAQGQKAYELSRGRYSRQRALEQYAAVLLSKSANRKSAKQLLDS